MSVSARGSAPIETVALITLLLVPIGPGVALYDQISNQLAAESIARHGVRAAMLQAERGQLAAVSTAVNLLSQSWQKPVTSYEVDRVGEFVTLRVQIKDAIAIATLGLEPTR